MITEKYAKSYCKDDISLIENYDKAIADTTQVWDCHHRRETIFSKADLIEIGEYYNRPACELIFLTKIEHIRIHHLGKHRSEDTRKKMSEALSGENNPMFGKPSAFKDKHHSAEARKKMSEALKGENNPLFGKHHSAEARKKMSKSKKGKTTWVKDTRWYNNGVKSIRAKTCPEGFVKGRIKK